MLKRIREDIKTVFQRDPAARTTLEVIFNSPGLHAIWFYRVSHYLWNKRFKFIARTLSTLSRFITGVDIHPQAIIGERFFIDHGMGVVIGATAKIGDDCSIYHGVTLGGTKPYENTADDKRHPTLENNVVIGASASILGPITLGDNCRVGSGSVVIKDIPRGVTVATVPAQIISYQKESKQTIQYGIGSDLHDPLVEGIEELKTKINQLKKDLNKLKQKE